MSSPDNGAPRRRLSPRRRAQRIRAVQYAVLIAVIGAAVLFAD